MRLDAEVMAARGRTSLRARVARLRSKAWVISQCAIAAGVAWWLAADVLGHRLPFFAPIAAVVSLGMSYGQRQRRVAEVTAARGPAVDGIPEALLALYERLREQKGIGAALLRARQCGGCNMTLDASELSRIRSAPVDEVVRCEECQRILVRTDESGL